MYLNFFIFIYIENAPKINKNTGYILNLYHRFAESYALPLNVFIGHMFYQYTINNTLHGNICNQM